MLGGDTIGHGWKNYFGASLLSLKDSIQILIRQIQDTDPSTYKGLGP